MPLLKLWNSIRGKATADSASEPVVQPAKPLPSDQPAQAPEAIPSVAAQTRPNPAKASKPSAQSVQPSQPKQSVRPSANEVRTPKSKRGLLGRSLPKSPLLKKLMGVTATSVLEIGVGDGSRAIEIVSFLQGGQDGSERCVRYAAVDQFEMGGGETTLMQFHQTLRSESIRPQVFPEPIESGLLRVAHTLGAMDLVLVSDPSVDCGSLAFQGLLNRVTHTHSRVLGMVEGRWVDVPFDASITTRRAA